MFSGIKYGWVSGLLCEVVAAQCCKMQFSVWILVLLCYGILFLLAYKGWGKGFSPYLTFRVRSKTGV